MILAILHKIVRFAQRLKVQLHGFPKHFRNFGFKMAIYIVMDRLFPPGRSKRYMAAVYNYLNDNYSDIAKKAHDYAFENKCNTAKTIWVCWFQGEDAMPELVKMCYNNLKKQIKDPDIKLILLTYENIDKYVDIPSIITEKYKNGSISNAHYSDILRIKLLRKHGGCWIDSTIFVTAEFKRNLFDHNFFTLKMPADKCPKEPCLGLWSGFFLIAKNNLPLFCIIDECLDRYWQTHDEIIDYIFIDYLMLLAYHNNSIVRSIMDSVPYNNEQVWLLWDNLEKPYDAKLFDEIRTKGQFYKLSYQKKINKEIEGRETIYGRLTNWENVGI